MGPGADQDCAMAFGRRGQRVAGVRGLPALATQHAVPLKQVMHEAMLAYAAMKDGL